MTILHQQDLYMVVSEIGGGGGPLIGVQNTMESYYLFGDSIRGPSLS